MNYLIQALSHDGFEGIGDKWGKLHWFSLAGATCETQERFLEEVVTCARIQRERPCIPQRANPCVGTLESVYRRTANQCSSKMIVAVHRYPTNTLPTPQNYVQLLLEIVVLRYEVIESARIAEFNTISPNFLFENMVRSAPL